jgi:hypothetical protein
MLIALVIFYTVLTAIFTYPLILKFSSAIPGFFGTDEPSIWYYWWLDYAHTHRISSKFSDLIAYPFGLDVGISEKIFPLGILLKKILTYASNEIMAHNLEIFATFVLCGLFTYLLVMYLTQNKFSALFSSLIYTFCPYHFARVWQHLTLAHIEWFPLLLLGLFKLRGLGKIRISALVIVVLGIIFSFDLYLGYFSIFIFTTFFLFNLVLRQKNKKIVLINLILNGFIAFFLVLAVLLPVILQVLAAPSSSVGAWSARARPFEDLFMQSARPLSYILPSAFHPIMGKLTEQFVGADFYGRSYTEHTLYLGWIALIFAFIALKNRIRQKSSSSKERCYLNFFIFLALAAWLISQPPWWNIFSLKIYMPSFFMYKLLPMFRAYCRFGIVVMLAVAVLAGFGLKFVLDRLRSLSAKVAITVLLFSLVLFEFWNYPPYKVIDLNRVPQVYYWLKQQPGDFVIAEYPLDSYSPNENYKFFQTKHYKKIINGTIPGTYAHKVAQAITRLSSKGTTQVLKWMGVRYVLVHHDGYLETELAEDREELDKIAVNKELKFIKSFPSQECPQNDIMCVQKTGSIDVYEVVAQPVKPVLNSR